MGQGKLAQAWFHTQQPHTQMLHHALTQKTGFNALKQL
jgi:hypothetical protein